MFVEDVDLSIPIPQPQLFLCKNNLERTTIANLSEAYNIELNPKFGQISELNFSVPYEIDVNNQLVKNPNVKNLLYKYIIKVKLDTYEDYFIIDKPNSNMTESEDVKNIKCYSLAYELKDKNIRNYTVTAKSINQIFSGFVDENGIEYPSILYETNWSLGYVDSNASLLYRGFTVASKTLLDFLYEIADTFNCVIVFDNKNKIINFYNPLNLGTYKGLRFSYGRYLNSFDYEPDYSNMCTRLKLFGKNNIGINQYNPTGSNYLENYTYFLYPFERDENKNVIRSSNYFPDDLCNALLDYQELVSTKENEFSALIEQKELKQTELTILNNQLDNLELELEIINDNYDTAYSSSQDTSDLLIQRENKETEIANKQIEINNKEAEIQNIDTQISTLKSTLAMDNNFTPEQIFELNNYIIIKELTNTNINNAKDLYEWGKQEFIKIITPVLNINIDSVNLLSILEAQPQWNMFLPSNLGDIIKIYYDKMDLDVEAKIIEFNYNFEDQTCNLIISNTKDISDDKEKFIKDLNNAISTSTVVDMNKYKFTDIPQIQSDINQIINSKWDANKNAVVAGENQNYSLDKRGLILKSPTDEMNFLRALHNILTFTNDGGYTYKNALTPQGLVAENVYGLLGAFCEIRANQITVGDLGEKITDDVINSSEYWNSIEQTVNQYTINQLNNFIDNTYSTDLSDIQSQIDGNITSWFYAYEPSLTNAPTNEWITDIDKNNHLGDLFYDTNTGYAYRFALENTIYKWIKITDSDVTKALANASLAQDVADSKRRVFMTVSTNTPIPPYDVGDLWRIEGDNDFKICVVTKIKNELFAETDWEYATNIKNYIDGEITEVNTSISNLELNVNNILSDSKITEIEANTLKLSLNQVKSESTDLINIGTTLELTTETTNYSTALTNLETELSNWINQEIYPLDITTTDRTNINTKFESVQNTKSILINKITEKREDNATAVAELAQGTADNAYNTATASNVNLLKNGGAEICTNENNLPDYWNIWQNNSGACSFTRRVNDPEWTLSGNASFEINQGVSVSGSIALYSQIIALPKIGKNYTFSCIAEAHRCIGYIILVFYDSNDNVILEKQSQKLNNIYEPTKLVITEACPANTSYISAQLRKEDTNVGDTSSYLFADNVKLEEGDIATPYIETGDADAISQAKTKADNSVQQNTLYNNVSINSTDGVKCTHNDGSYTQLKADGLKRFVAGSGKEYHYLMYVGEGQVLRNLYDPSQAPELLTVTLPDEFKGKNFEVTVTIVETGSISSAYEFRKCKLRVTSKDIANGTFRLEGYTQGYNGSDFYYGGVVFSYTAIC